MNKTSKKIELCLEKTSARCLSDGPAYVQCSIDLEYSVFYLSNGLKLMMLTYEAC